jgi:hypothetical protein
MERDFAAKQGKRKNKKGIGRLDVTAKYMFF